MCVIILNTVSFALVAEGLYPLRENLLPKISLFALPNTLMFWQVWKIYVMIAVRKFGIKTISGKEYPKNHILKSKNFLSTDQSRACNKILQ